MNNLWLRIKVWTKVLLIAAIFVYIIVFTYKNASQPKVRFWYWVNRQPDTNLLLLVLGAFLAGVICAFLLRTMLRTVRQVQEIQSRGRVQRLDRAVADMQAKAAMLRSKPDLGAETSVDRTANDPLQ